MTQKVDRITAGCRISHKNYTTDIFSTISTVRMKGAEWLPYAFIHIQPISKNRSYIFMKEIIRSKPSNTIYVSLIS